ncbi:MAG: hypothetical protein PHH14_05865 [Candidatus Margulisbacteria bacterium]|nr:hypothetical protein [Candidatus Margulisiibacteriota bacterium]
MAKSTTNATPICLGLSILLLIGIIIGLVKLSPLVIIIFLLPTVIYEVYRTEGESTKMASWGLLGVILAEIVAVIFNLNFNLASFLGTSGRYIGGYYLPLGEIKMIFPGLMAILAIILFTRTNGFYTRWLAVLIFIGSLATVYTLDAAIFQQFLKLGINQGLNQLNF